MIEIFSGAGENPPASVAVYIMKQKESTMNAHKNFHILAALGAAALLGLTSCHKDDDSPDPLKQKVYSGFTELSVTYDGAPVSGKQVTLTPQADGTACLDVEGFFNISQLGGDFKDMPPVRTAGVLPGTPTLTLTAPMHADGDAYSFSGSGSTDYASYSYSGRVSDEKMQLNFTDVKLLNQSLAGMVMKPAPIEQNENGVGWKSSPFHFVWEANLPDNLGININGDILQMLANLPFIPAYGGTAEMSLAQVVANGLQTLAFAPNGNLVMTYLQNSQGAAQFAKAPLCMMQYLSVTQDVFQFYLNPTDLLTVVLLNNDKHSPDIPENPFGAPRRAVADNPGSGSATTNPVTEHLKQLLMQTLVKLAPQLPNGIPLFYSPTANGVNVYLGHQDLMPVAKAIVQTILTDPELQKLIMEAVQKDPALLQQLPKIKELMEQLPAILELTTRLEIGLSLVSVKS